MMQHYVKSERHVPPWCFLILAAPVLLFVINGWLVPQLGVPRLEVTAAELLRDAPDYLEAAGRNRFLGALIFFVTVVTVGIVAFVFELLRPLSARTKVIAIAALLAVQVPVVSSILSHQGDTAGTWRTYHQLGDGVMQEVLSRGSVRRCETYDAVRDIYVPNPGGRLMLGRICTDNPVMQMFRTVLDIVNVLSGFGVAALVLGMILSLARPPGNTPLEMKAFIHGRNQRIARRFLYLAGLMLSAGMFLTISWMNWPMPMVDTEAHPGYAEVINATLFYNGIFYSLLIATGFGPVMFLAARRSDALAMEMLAADQSAEPDDEAPSAAAPTVSLLDEWKASHGLRISMTEAFQALFATCSPLITVFAGGFSPI